MPDLNDARVLSVDVFDTLLLRAVPRPIDAFPLVADRGHAQGMVRPSVTRAQFAAVRQAAEADARQQAQRTRNSFEVSLAEIYRAMPTAWFPAGAGPLPRVEVEAESDLAYVNPAVLALVREAHGRGVPVVLTSDTCFSAADIAVLLEHAGVDPGWFAHVFVSSEHGVSKHDGGLFAQLCARFPHVAPRAIHHIGDHPYSDGQQAVRAGLTAIRYDNGQEALRPLVRLESLRHGSVLPALQSLRALATRVDAPADADLRWWFGLGASTLGPALAVFADWVVDECQRDGITAIRPLMREGALFATLIARAAAARGRRLDVAPLHASRGATWLAGLGPFDEGAIAVLLQRSHLSVREALRVVGLDATDTMQDFEAVADLNLGQASAACLPDGRIVSAALRDALHSPVARAHVAKHQADSRATLCAYLDHACGSADTVALVDLGFHGSTGRAIAAATCDTSSRRYVQFLVFGAAGLARAWSRGEDIRVFGAGPGANADLAGPIVRHPAVLESLLIEGGTTVGYRRDGDLCEPRVETSRTPATQRAAAEACREGVLAFQTRWLGWASSRPAQARAVVDDRRGLAAPIHRLLTMPTPAEADRLGDWVHEDNEGGDGVRRLTHPDAVPDGVTPQAFLHATASGGCAWGTSWAWPAGTCARRWPGYFDDLWQDAVGADDGSPPAVQVLATRLRREGVTRCHMWGAGEVGLAMLCALRREGVQVRLVIDSNPALHGTLLEGVPVVSPEAADASDAEVFVIASFAFAEEITQRLREIHRGRGDAVRIVHPTAEIPA
jgi:FMN phosphatase YigB (HAD superfamily)